MKTVLPFIGIDIDDTLVDCYDQVLAFFRYLAAQGVAHSPETYARTHCWKQMLDGKAVDQIYQRFQESGLAPSPKSMPGAQQALQVISRAFEIHLITGRNRYSLAQIQPDLKHHVLAGLPPHFFWPRGGRSKRRIIQILGLSHYIDESVAELGRLIEIPDVNLIQFPSFWGGRSPRIDHSRVMRLAACDEVGILPDDEVKSRAWQQIQEIVFNSI